MRVVLLSQEVVSERSNMRQSVENHIHVVIGLGDEQCIAMVTVQCVAMVTVLMWESQSILEIEKLL